LNFQEPELDFTEVTQSTCSIAPPHLGQCTTCFSFLTLSANEVIFRGINYSPFCLKSLSIVTAFIFSSAKVSGFIISNQFEFNVKTHLCKSFFELKSEKLQGFSPDER
jgi:hypothetical protein